MSKQCSGCGAILQYDNMDAVGYAPKEDALVCQRCFRLTHYNDAIFSMQQGMDNEAILKSVKDIDAIYLWVFDVFDMESNTIELCKRHLYDRDIILIATKCDLLPKSLGDEKLIKFIKDRCMQWGVRIIGVVLCANLQPIKKPSIDKVQGIINAVDAYANNRKIVVFGNANAGKSSILNTICQKQRVTISAHPGTTLGLQEIIIDDDTYIDTPGFSAIDSALSYMNGKDLKMFLPQKPLKPRSYQIYEDQSLAIGGSVRIDLVGGKDVRCVAYFASALPIHRGKTINADALWQQHFNGMLAPCLSEDVGDMIKFTFACLQNPHDYVIHGLGWFTIKGDAQKIHIYVSKPILVSMRKAMM